MTDGALHRAEQANTEAALDIARRAARAARLRGAEVLIDPHDARYVLIRHAGLTFGETQSTVRALLEAGVVESIRWLEAQAKAGALEGR